MSNDQNCVDMSSMGFVDVFEGHNLCLLTYKECLSVRLKKSLKTTKGWCKIISNIYIHLGLR